MKSQISKWGNSLALRIPKGTAKRLGLEEEGSVFIYDYEGKLVVEKADDLNDLLARITPENLPGETDWNGVKGREEW